MILNVENLRKCNNKKLIELINNLSNLWDRKSVSKIHLFLCIPALTNLKSEINKNNYIYNSIKKSKILRNKFF